MPAIKGLLDKSFGRKALDVAKYVGKGFVIGSGIIIPTTYFSIWLATGNFNLEPIKSYFEKVRIEHQMKTEHENEVNYFYNRLFENTKSFQDSVYIYQKYGLPIKLIKPTLKQKEEAIKQNELERSLK